MVFLNVCLLSSAFSRVLPIYVRFSLFHQDIFLPNLEELFFNAKMTSFLSLSYLSQVFSSVCLLSFILDMWKFYSIKFTNLILWDVFFCLVSFVLFKNHFFGLWGWLVTWLLYRVPNTAVTNCLTISGLKQYKVIILQFWGSEDQSGSPRVKIMVSAWLCSIRRF